jgi:hypothetical protein
MKSTCSPSLIAMSRQSVREMTGLDHQHGVARREGIGERRLPGARPEQA